MKKVLSELRTGKDINKSRRLTFVTGVVVLAVSSFLALVGLFGYRAYDQRVNGPKAAEILKRLETDFKMIPPLPNAVELRCGSMHKTRQGDVSCEYKTGLPYEQIKAHYDRELRNRGWTFVKERPVKIWSKDYGGKEAIYCKGIYDATLQYAGAEPGIEWTFGLSLSWGLSDECK